ncbi:MAG: hypothetical protein ACTMKZ_12465 [Brevibacterium aurantiacum]|uniref:Uncharacterized protein n=1 Tax=Brevibacterium aurantiacum TaxID=273384 RepID=A0A2A3X352_BREAU|nr:MULTISPECIES: hypothetical protein [Brevibacterium]MDN5594441.1 hypothetical protein [Brevibacterium sp.]AZL07340.1 hypothetical protein CXR24_18460 [Brevibacterium aurantiacum]AZL10940.1 hypothetical protein CXR26_18225 [Brevibacterium aurantiacum]AZL14541.1 hypothetical protein CXR25_18155 [Brevibacterium aurantiacum]AZT98868.1 hypothetical protein CXR27_19160 [Brevibacterium aurantiacum]
MPQLLEVWNDTVDSKHLVGSIAIGIGVAVPAFLISDHLFTTTGDPELGHSYALLIGIVGCIIGAVIAGILFKPKRVITQSEADTRNRQEVIDEVVEEYGDLGDPRDLKPGVQEEIRALGLFDALVENHENRAKGAQL